jgi:hypothetical protein
MPFHFRVLQTLGFDVVGPEAGNTPFPSSAIEASKPLLSEVVLRFIKVVS